MRRSERLCPAEMAGVAERKSRAARERKIQYLDTYFVPPDLGEERDGPGEVVEKETGALLPALGSVTS